MPRFRIHKAAPSEHHTPPLDKLPEVDAEHYMEAVSIYLKKHPPTAGESGCVVRVWTVKESAQPTPLTTAFYKSDGGTPPEWRKTDLLGMKGIE